MKEETIIWVFGILLLLMLQKNISLTNEVQNYANNATFKMYNKEELRPYVRLNGLAVNDEYFCVWTKDRTDKAISDTILHEWLHIKVKKADKFFS